MAGQEANKPVQSYRDLVAWQQAMDLAEAVYTVTKNYPNDERFGLTSQMRRAAVSIASNIAEGQGRQSTGEMLQFIGHARGSLAELGTQVILSARVQLLTPEQQQSLEQIIARVGRLLNGLRKSLIALGS